MSFRRAPPSISPNVFDPTTVTGSPKPRDPAAPPLQVELAVEGPVLQKVATIAVRPEDKAVFDALQAWWAFRYGERLTQWEVFSVLLSDAAANRGGRLSSAFAVVS